MTSVRVSGSSQQLRVTAEDRDEVAVEGRADVTVDGERTTISGIHGGLVVRVPNGSALVIGTDSGRGDVDGAVGTVAVTTVSGRVTIKEAVTVDARTKSAQVTIGHADRECRVRSESGRIEIEMALAADVDAETVSGQIAVNLATGSMPFRLDDKQRGAVRPEGYDCTIRAVSQNGRIDVSSR